MQTVRGRFVRGPHCRDKHLGARELPTRANIVGKAGEVLKLLLNLARADERATPLLAVADTFIDKIGNGLAGGHATDAISLTQLALGGDEFTWSPLAGTNLLEQDFLELIVDWDGAVSVNDIQNHWFLPWWRQSLSDTVSQERAEKEDICAL